MAQVHKISIPFYIIGIIFIIAGVFFLYDYLEDLFEIFSYSNWIKIKKGATIKHITIESRPNNIFVGLPVIAFVGNFLLPGQTYVILVEYEYELDGKKFSSRNYDLVATGYKNKLDAQIKFDGLNGSKVDFYIDPTKSKSYLFLNDFSDLGIPKNALAYFLVGLFLIYGGYLLPGFFNKIPTKIEAILNKKLGLKNIELDFHDQKLGIESVSNNNNKN